ncbi:hypothetical protein D5S17_26935 [Pseudonocardiaceae bacterium YIM PH 21723]|nr:hypothetical protein D5S17_26935 [Pseudonocardiaceae bacterium YIM PH 21723]
MTLYLGCEDDAERVESALADVLSHYGLEIRHVSWPVVRSWFRRLGVWFKTSDTADRISRDLERAVELRVLHQAQAQVDAAQGDVVAKLISSLENTQNALIQVGSVLLLKVNGVLSVRNLTQRELALLEHRPELFSNPAGVLQALQTDMRSAGDTDRRHLSS